jgi:acetoacetyl-CoA synthetase
MDSIPRWFEGVYMNFAENLLYKHTPGTPTSQRGTIGKEDTKIALTEVREGATEIRDVSWGQLRREVAQLASAMKGHGVRKGDRVVVVASNSVDTLKVFLAVTTLGGIFSSSSTDMGVQGVLQRTLQVTPKVCQISKPELRIIVIDLRSIYSWTTLLSIMENESTSDKK